MRFFAPKPLNFTKILLISVALAGCSTGPQQAIFPRITPPDPAPLPGQKPAFSGFAPAMAGSMAAPLDTVASTRIGGGGNSEVGSQVVAVELAPLTPQPSMTQSSVSTTPQAAPAGAQVAALAPTQSGGGERTYVVRLGDTLYGLARREGLSVHSLAGQNNLTPPYDLQSGSA